MALAYGFAGAVIALSLFGAGVFAGWQVHAHTTRPAARRPGERERRRLREEQDAFRRLQNYTVEDAYGLSDERM